MQQRPPHISIAVARQTAPIGFNCIHSLDTATEPEVLNSLEDKADVVFDPAFILAEAQNVARIVGELNVAGADHPDGLLGVLSHLLCKQVDRSVLSSK